MPARLMTVQSRSEGLVLRLLDTPWVFMALVVIATVLLAAVFGGAWLLIAECLA